MLITFSIDSARYNLIFSFLKYFEVWNINLKNNLKLTAKKFCTQQRLTPALIPSQIVFIFKITFDDLGTEDIESQRKISLKM